MLKKNSIILLLLASMILTPILLQAANNEKKYPKFRILVYNDENCTDIAQDAWITPNGCDSYSYVDAAGVTTYGSQGNFVCHPGYLEMSIYPTSPNCGGNPAESAHLIGNKCNKTVTHNPDTSDHEHPLLTISEQLMNYAYPGNADCSCKKGYPCSGEKQ